MRACISYVVRLWSLCVGLCLAGCSASKFVPDGAYMLDDVSITSDDKRVDVAMLEPYIRQKGNSKWFSLLKVPLATYALAGTDSTKWLNRTLKRIGEEPVIYDTLQARLSQENLRSALMNMGYMHADVSVTTKTKGKKVSVDYTLHPGDPYFIRRLSYDIQDSSIRRLMASDSVAMRSVCKLREGDRLTVDALDGERKGITNYLLDHGYYRFHKDFIQIDADSTAGERGVDITLHLLPYRANSNAEPAVHPRYTVRQVSYHSGDEGGKMNIRQRVLQTSTAIVAGQPYCNSDLQRTYNNFSRLGAVRYTNIAFREQPDSLLLDCDIHVSTNKQHTIAFQPEGTNTSGDLGAAASLTYTNRNVFRGAEQLSVELRGAFEAITGLEGYQDQNYQEYSLEGRLLFPHLLAPFVSNSFRRRSRATSELSLNYDLQNRPEFHRRVFSAAWRYRWDDERKHLKYRFDLLDLNYVYMPWISATFKHDYLDSVSNRNAILRYNYEDLFIMKVGFGLTYTTANSSLRLNVETSGNLLNLASRVTRASKNEQGQYTFFNIAYAQYARLDFDYTHLRHFDKHNALALHADFGIAYPYGNSNVLPFEKRYFSGGANSVRGWSVRGLGPGKFRGTDGRIDFINQTGDMKLDLSAEYRTFLFWKFDGAVFVDAGNIWTLRDYEEQPGGQFKLDEFYKQIAVSYGLGLRLNFGYFVLRFDAGMKAINPAYETSREHYPIVHPDFSRDFAFHFAVGLPF